MVKHNELEIDSRFSADRQQLFWKGAILLLCAGIFALILWSGAHDNHELCKAAAGEACITQPQAQAPRPPAKGALAPVHAGSIIRSAD